MNIITKNSLSSDEWQTIRTIYEESFPVEERRPWPLIISPEDPAFALIAICTEAQEVIGLYTHWRLEHCHYYEHLAISSEHRGTGVGQAIIRLWHKEAVERPIILEVELSERDAMARRRIEFYKRNGLYLLPYDYIQPAYSKDLSSVPMHIMSSQALDRESFGQIRDELYSRVYSLNL